MTMNKETQRLYNKIHYLCAYAQGVMDVSEQPYDGIFSYIIDSLDECKNIIDPETIGIMEIKLDVE